MISCFTSLYVVYNLEIVREWHVRAAINLHVHIRVIFRRGTRITAASELEATNSHSCYDNQKFHGLSFGIKLQSHLRRLASVKFSFNSSPSGESLTKIA